MEKARVLIVEDDAIIAIDIENHLKSLGYSVPAIVASGEQAIQKAEKHRIDIVLMDIVLKGEMDGIEATDQIRTQFEIPVIFVTAFDDKDRLERAKLTYPFGYILKPFQAKDFEVSIEMALYIAKADFERKKIETALRESEEMARALLNAPANVMALVDTQGIILDANEAMAQRFGKNIDELIGVYGWDLLPPDIAEHRIPYFDQVIESGKSIRFEDESRGTWFDNAFFPLFDTQGKVIKVGLMALDITERKQAEEALHESEERFRNLSDAAFEAIAIHEGGVVISANDQYFEMFGYEPNEILGKQAFPLTVAPEERESVEKKVTTGGIGPYESIGLRKNGTKFPIEIRVREMEYKGRKVRVGAVMDITARKRAEMALQESEAFLNATGQIAKVGGWEIDGETKKVFWTKEIYNINEVPPDYDPSNLEEEAIVFLNKKDQLIFEKAIQRAFEHAEPYNMEFLITTAKGNKKWVQTICEPIVVDGKVTKLKGTFQDIDDRKQAEEALLESESKLRQAQKMESIGTLAGGIAHEFNNILGIIIANTELGLMDVPDWNPGNECLKEIRKASLRAKDVVRQIMSFARKTPFQRKPLQISTIIKESLKLIRATIPTIIEIRQAVSCESEMILAVPTEISQVFMNLCTNSAYAMGEGAGVLEVDLKAINLDDDSAAQYEDLKSGDFVKLTVRDTGHGMKPEILDRIFDPYFTTKEVNEGLGMGMAVVHGIVKKHDGAIKVSSEIGKGTVVEVLFPLIKEAVEPESKEESADLPGGTECILFVDDEESLVKAVELMMERSGYEVVTKTNPMEALALFETEPDRFDLIITDMAMPHLTGDRLAQELMKIRKDIPVILCTGHSARIDEDKAKELGLAAYIMKPLVMKEFANTVRKVLDKAKDSAQD